MFENNQEQVAEETSDISNQVDTVQVNANASAPTATNVAQNKDYLNPGLFDDVKVIDKSDLLDNETDTKVSPELEDKYSNTFGYIAEHSLIAGRVVGMNERDVLIDIGFKSEGMIDRSEFHEDAIPEKGDQIEVYLEYLEDRNGNLVLSKEKADFMRSWKEIRKYYDSGEIFSCRIVKRIKGGMIVDINGLPGFLPGSQIDVRPIKDFDNYLDKDIEVRVVKLNEARKNIVVSHKVIIEDTLQEKRDEFLSEIEIGQIIEGRVKNITDFGVFIDLGGLDGLLHITDLSWGRVNHPSEIVELDETITVKIIDYDESKQRVSLGLKQLMPHPWENVEDTYPIGSKVKGKIVSLTNYGAFVEFLPGKQGLVHISELAWERVEKVEDVLKQDQNIKVKLIGVDQRSGKFKLSHKVLLPKPVKEES